MLEYTVVLDWDAEFNGCWVEVPALEGCVSQGKTRDEALKNVREAIELHLEAMKEVGEEPPQEESTRVIVEVST